jgi:Family of unknown function (DUF6152)
MKRLLVGTAIAVALGVGLPAFAHHSGAMFEREKTVTLIGTVKEFQYTNPHSWLIILVPSADQSTTAEWAFESEGPSTLLRVGIKAKTFQAGDKVTVFANPLKDGRPGGLLISATTATGTTYTTHNPAGGGGITQAAPAAGDAPKP